MYKRQVTATLETPRGQQFDARLISLAGKKLDKFDIPTAEAAEIAVHAVNSRTLKVQSVEAKPAARNPYAPFMTSTLQQEASRKFGMGAKACMSAAQRLYEAGHITYMRTDGIDMAPEAVAQARAEIGKRFGAAYVPDAPRIYKNKAKNAQEAHECIRPTDMAVAPDDLRLAEADQRKLYDLIWKRTIASQMAGARMERTTVDVASAWSTSPPGRIAAGLPANSELTPTGPSPCWSRTRRMTRIQAGNSRASVIARVLAAPNAPHFSDPTTIPPSNSGALAACSQNVTFALPRE